MKNTLILSTMICFFLACSSDDDAGNTLTLESQMLGTWKYTAVQVNDTDAGLEEGDCLLENTITYSANNQLTYEVHNEDASGDCLQQSFTDAWFIDGENSYISVQPGDDVVVQFFVDFINEDTMILSYEEYGDPEISITLVKL